MTIDSFLSKMSDREFEEKFLELARSESFSAIASGVGTQEDRLKVRDALLALELPIVLYKDEVTICVVVSMIASRMMRKK